METLQRANTYCDESAIKNNIWAILFTTFSINVQFLSDAWETALEKAEIELCI